MIPADPWAGLGPATIIRGDALNLPIPDSSVDLLVTSPPYFALRSYQDGGQHYGGQIGSEATPDEFVTSLLAATREMVRVLRPSGSIFVNLGDKYAGGSAAPGGKSSSTLVGTTSHTRGMGYVRPVTTVPAKSLIGVPWRYALRCIDELGLILRAEVVWSKPNGLPESVTDRVRRSHETWFHFTVSPRYFAAVDEIRDPYDEGTAKRYASGYNPDREAYSAGGPTKNGPARHDKGGPKSTNPLGKLPGSVREVPTAPLRVPAELGVDHFAAFPPAWPAWIIRGWSPSGVCVECGEGRRPLVRRDPPGDFGPRDVERMRQRKGTGPPGNGLNVQPTYLTDYACACPTPDAPTRPAVVLDPFGGTGTTAMAARALGRHGISVDLSADYCRLARWRVQDPDQLATVRGVPRQGKPADEAQASLLDLFGDEATA